MAKKIRGAIKHSNNSAAGPDGIPYAAYRSTARLSGEILTGVFGDLTSEGSWVPEEFNVAVMSCLPKKPAGTDPIHGDYYTPETTDRYPLSTQTIGYLRLPSRELWKSLQTAGFRKHSRDLYQVAL